MTRRATALILSAVAFACGVGQSGCSFQKASPPGGLAVKLAPQGSLALDRLAESQSLLHGPQDWLGITMMANVGNLNCFAVNARGGPIPTNSVCNSQADLGIDAGFVSDVNSTFSLPNVPLSDGLTFEAFGYQASNCSTLSSTGGFPFDTSIYQLGSVQPAASQLNSTITIPVSIGSSSFSCSSGGGQSGLFVDLFDYNPPNTGPLALAGSVSGTLWSTPAAPDDMTWQGNGDVLLNTGTTPLTDFVTSSVENFSDTGYGITMGLTLSSTGGSVGTGDLLVSIGFSDTQQNNAHSVGCYVDFNCSNASSCTLKLAAGINSTGGLFNTGTLTTEGSYSMGDPLSLSCDVTQLSGLLFVTAQVTDTSSHAIFGPVTNLSLPNPCSSNVCGQVFMSQSGPTNGITYAGSISSYIVVGVP